VTALILPLAAVAWLSPAASAAPPPSTASVPGFTPDPTQLPGAQVIQNLSNGLGFWALVAALAGLVIGAAAWALGSHSQNFHQSFVGRRTVLVSGLAALLIGAAPGIISFFFGAGRGVH
jgi:hypothetical protein